MVVVVTSRNAVGLSPRGGFTQKRLQLKEKLRDFPVKVQQHGDLYRVRIGLYSQRDEAEDVRRDLARLGFEAVIIPIN